MSADASPRAAKGDKADLASLGIGLLASPTAVAQAAAKMLQRRYSWADEGSAATLVALGGDGFMLQTLHQMLESGKPRPVFGMNRGTVGFLMNEWRLDRLAERIAKAKPIRVAPLTMEATTVAGETHRHAAINEVSLLRETRQTAKIEILVDGAVSGTAQYGFSRTDVKRVYPAYNNENAGYEYMLDTTKLSNGKHTITIRATSKTGKVTTLPGRTVTVTH